MAIKKPKETLSNTKTNVKGSPLPATRKAAKKAEKAAAAPAEEMDDTPVVSFEDLQSAAMDLNDVLQLEPEIDINKNGEEIICDLKKAAELLEYADTVDVGATDENGDPNPILKPETINTLKELEIAVPGPPEEKPKKEKKEKKERAAAAPKTPAEVNQYGHRKSSMAATIDDYVLAQIAAGNNTISRAACEKETGCNAGKVAAHLAHVKKDHAKIEVVK